MILAKDNAQILETSPYLFWVPLLVLEFGVLVKYGIVYYSQFSIYREKWKKLVVEHEHNFQFGLIKSVKYDYNSLTNRTDIIS